MKQIKHEEQVKQLLDIAHGLSGAASLAYDAINRGYHERVKRDYKEARQWEKTLKAALKSAIMHARIIQRELNIEEE